MKAYLLASALALAPSFALAQAAGVLDLAARPGVTQQVIDDLSAYVP